MPSLQPHAPSQMPYGWLPSLHPIHTAGELAAACISNATPNPNPNPSPNPNPNSNPNQVPERGSKRFMSITRDEDGVCLRHTSSAYSWTQLGGKLVS